MDPVQQRPRTARRWLQSGTTTIEAKTGYHLTRDGELADVRMLRSLENEPGMPRVHVTFYAAQMVPPEFFGRRSDYIDAVSSWCADAAAVGADSVDVNCEDGRFTRGRGALDPQRGPPRRPAAAAARLRQRARSSGAAGSPPSSAAPPPTCCYAATDEDVAALSRGGVAAVISPGSALQQGVRKPPVRSLLDKGVVVALGSDHTPGGVGITSMPLVIALAVSYLGMSVTEALRAATLGGAYALRAPDRGAHGPRPPGRHRPLGRRPRGRLRLELRPDRRAASGAAASPSPPDQGLIDPIQPVHPAGRALARHADARPGAEAWHRARRAAVRIADR